MNGIRKKLSVLAALLLTCSFAFSACNFAMMPATNAQTSTKSSSSRRKNSSNKKNSSDKKDSSEEEDSGEEMTIKAVSPKDKKKVSLVNSDVQAFLEAYDIGASEDYATGEDHFAMKGLDLVWESEVDADQYEIQISTSEDLADALVLTTEETTLHVDDLLVNTQYYWQITAETDDGEVASEVYTFTTYATPRTISIDGVSNTRDIGGKTTVDGKKIKQGMIYRGAYLDEITPSGITQALEKYGIKTDLDVRKAAEGTAGMGSPLGSGVKYVQYSCPYYLGSQGINNEANWENLANAIKTFAQEENYPIYFHCSLGRDRTAMVALLLEGLLGATMEDMTIDYEMSFFSSRGCVDGAKPRDMVATFINTRRYLETYDSDKSLSFAQQCEKYLLDIGVTQAEIDAIREIMLENE